MPQRTGAMLLALVLALVVSVASCELMVRPAQGATFALGSPVQRPGSADWYVPIYVLDFTHHDLQGASLKVEVSGDAYANEPGSYLPDAVVMSHMDGDTLIVDVVKGSGLCEPTGVQGVLAWLRVVGAGAYTLRRWPMARDCTNAPLPADVLQERVLVPPEQPIPVRRSSWGALKAVYR